MFDDTFKVAAAVKISFTVNSSPLSGDASCDPANVTCKKYVAVLGPQSSDLCRATSSVYNSLNMPQISHYCTDPRLSDKVAYPGFTRNVFTTFVEMSAFASVIKQFGWQRVGIITTNNDYGLSAIQALVSQLPPKVQLIQALVLVTPTGTSSEDPAPFQSLKDQDLKIIVYVHGGGSTTPILMRVAKSVGLSGPGYVWLIGNDAMSGLGAFKANESSLVEGSIGVTSFVVPDSYYLNFLEAQKTSEFANISLFMGVMHCHDTLLVLGDTIHRMIQAGENLRNYTLFLKRMSETDTTGLTGRIVFNQTTLDRLQDLAIVSIRNLTTARFGTYRALNKTVEMTGQHIFSTGSTSPPPDRTPLVQTTISTSSFIGICFFAAFSQLLSVFAFFAVIAFRKHQAIQHSNVGFMLIICVSVFLMLTSVYFFALDAYTTNADAHQSFCKIQPWMVGIPFAMITASFAIKAFKIFLIFFRASQMVVQKAPFWLDLIYLSMFVGVEAIINAVWISDKPWTSRVYTNDKEFWWVCGSDNNVMLGLWIGFKGVVVGSACLTAYLTRNIDKRFNESKLVAFLIYNILIFSVVGLVLLYLLREQQESLFFMKSLILIFLCLTTLAIQYGPKFIYVYKPPSSSSGAPTLSVSRGLSRANTLGSTNSA
eukprot:TRINITY_DN7501_c0_g1_i1.p1 TRINITY_DN7501_c0_g1~~TRINITY_DN7501_c0_g1_i1.p1  ORF type:complete len:653 (-),score=129.99 TRINITY_DN7501_c0_g1_i1:61-2019(-)